jgi:lysophospholipase L1-like esterase
MLFVNAISLSLAALLILWAVRSDPDWFDRHVLPNYCPRATSTLVFEACARWGAALLALFVALVLRPKIATWAAGPRGPGARRMAAPIAGAALLALALCDLFLRVKEKRPRLEDDAGLPPMRIDATGNYVPIPSRVKEFEVQGRNIHYEIDADGNRARATRDVADLDAPTILFTGESITQGWGVAYEQTYPNLVGRALGVQTVNLAVTGFSSDQAFLRLREALPKFVRPLAVVTIVLPTQLERTVSDGRRRLALRDGRLELVPPSSSWLLTSPLRKLVPYHSDEALSLTHSILTATLELARTRGARALFVFTDFGAPCLPDQRGTSRLERRLFSDLGDAYTRVEIPPALMIRYPNEVHPNEEGHDAIARAVVRALQKRGETSP